MKSFEYIKAFVDCAGFLSWEYREKGSEYISVTTHEDSTAEFRHGDDARVFEITVTTLEVPVQERDRIEIIFE